MSTIPAVTEVLSDSKIVVAWNGMAAGDDGQPVDVSDWPIRSVRVTGLSGGEHLVLEGSNDGVNWTVLASTQSQPVGGWIVASRDVLPLEPRFLRSRLSAGLSSGVNAVMFCSK